MTIKTPHDTHPLTPLLSALSKRDTRTGHKVSSKPVKIRIPQPVSLVTTPTLTTSTTTMILAR